MELLKKAHSFALQNRRHWPSAAFALGFIWDSLTLTRVDLLYDNIVLTTYLAAATAGIIVFHAGVTGRLRQSLRAKLTPWLPLIIQFAFGGLFSGYVIYYSRSASLIGSWPFILFLLVLFIGNERFKKYYEQLTFQVSILFIAIFSYCIFSIPVLIGNMGTAVFLLSGIVSVALIAAVVALLRRVSRTSVEAALRGMTVAIAGIYAAFLLAYFTNIIPPIPLSLKELAIYHKVESIIPGSYELTFEKAPWYRFWEKTNPTFHRFGTELAYAYSAVFAPTRIDTTILHRWSRYDEASNRWIETSRIPFAISGGRDGGYRGYSLKQSLTDGKWRVDVITQNGQLLGRRIFQIESTPKPVSLELRVD